MLDINFIRANPKQVDENAAQKGVKVEVAEILKLDEELRSIITQQEAARAEQKAASRTKPDKKTIVKLRTLGDTIAKLKARQREVGDRLSAQLHAVPAMVRPDVPVGRNEQDNVVVREVGAIPKFSFQPKDYLALGLAHDVVDVERAGKVSGTRFVYFKRGAAMLEFALVRYALDTLVGEHGFIPVIPPVMVNRRSMTAMGYLENGGESETYHFDGDDLFFVGTSEQSVGPYHMDEVLAGDTLPLRYCAFSTCFRREAGAAGKDTRGFLRLHQFDKLEMFVYCRPEQSDAEHEKLLAIEEQLVQGLELSYRVVNCCTGELGGPAAKKYDIETWLPSQQTYRETHSTSNCVDFQARRLNIRYKDSATGHPAFVHTLNGTAFAMPRIFAMLFEQHQRADGKIIIPKILRPYLPGNPELLG
ncbi:MAG: serine--tRNA ligase [Patescibacteria group bacterium]|nr:serine--tRNA ligase [Patescibacteria group bacterium]